MRRIHASSERPLLIAHRGDPAHAPENTLLSIRGAAAKGARAVEVDARRSKDGVWVAFHDPSLRRITGSSGVVSRTPWTVLRKHRIPSIQQVLSFCRKKNLRLFLDVKVSRGEQGLSSAIRRSGWGQAVWVGAGNPASLRRWRRVFKETPLFWVTGYRACVSGRRIGQAKKLKLTGIVVYKGWVNPSSVRRVHEKGLKLYVWTVRTGGELRRFSRMGVDAMMSEVWPAPSI
ncbi:MAG: hypothetical protein HYZ90_06320 [Candidatus Omnitrophica bacterium]|nr:hypothetical protein [Candidatus Omnitrophota bacterium]